jgi:hypothetical protein
MSILSLSMWTLATPEIDSASRNVKSDNPEVSLDAADENA